MSKYGILINYEFCVGCHACELACRQEHKRPLDQCGINLVRIDPELSGGRLYYLPFFTDNCNLCGRRLARGALPACVSICWAQVMQFGPINELVGQVKKKMVLWAPH